MAVRHLVTADELERMGSKDFELVRGELVPVTPAGYQHGALVSFLTTELSTFARAHDLGRVFVEVGYKLFSNPDTVRGPDVSFLPRDRHATLKRRQGFIHGVPELAVEVVPFDKTLAELFAKGRRVPRRRHAAGVGGRPGLPAGGGAPAGPSTGDAVHH